MEDEPPQGFFLRNSDSEFFADDYCAESADSYDVMDNGLNFAPVVRASTQVSVLECADVLAAEVSPRYSPTSLQAVFSSKSQAMDRAEQVTESLVEEGRLPAKKAETKESECSRVGSMRTSLRTKRSKKKMVKEEDDDEGEGEEEEITLRALSGKTLMNVGEDMEVQEVSRPSKQTKKKKSCITVIL